MRRGNDYCDSRHGIALASSVRNGSCISYLSGGLVMTKRVEFKEREGRGAVNDKLMDMFEVGGPTDYVTSRQLCVILEPVWREAVCQDIEFRHNGKVSTYKTYATYFTGKRLALAIRQCFPTMRTASSTVIKVDGVPTKVYKGLKLIGGADDN